MGINTSLLKSIQTLIDKAINIAPFDKTRQSQVVKNNNDGTYTIRLDGILYDNVSSNPESNSIKAGDIVKVCIPSNQNSQMYIMPSFMDSDNILAKQKNGTIDILQNVLNSIWESLDNFISEVRQWINSYTRPTQVNLGTCYCAGNLTSTCSSLTFTIPTGRVLGDGASISKLTFNIVVRASNSNGAGYYIIKATSGGSDAKAFDSTKSFSFYNANNVSKTLTTSQRTITLQGATNILVNFAGASDIFSGTPTIRNYINNNACIVTLTNIVVKLSYS